MGKFVMLFGFLFLLWFASVNPAMVDEVKTHIPTSDRNWYLGFSCEVANPQQIAFFGLDDAPFYENIVFGTGLSVPVPFIRGLSLCHEATEKAMARMKAIRYPK